MAKATKAAKGKNRGGRPCLFEQDPEFVFRTLEDLADSNATTDSQIARALGISTSTLDSWKKRFPGFLGSLKKAKDKTDDLVENALLSRALGSEYIETKTYKVLGPDTIDEDGNKVLGQVTKRHIETNTKRAVGSVTAQIIWLKNRRPGEWRDNRDEEGAEELAEAIKLFMVETADADGTA